MNNCVLALEQIYQIQNLAKQEQIYSTSMQTKIKNKMGLKTATIMKICQKLYTCPKSIPMETHSCQHYTPDVQSKQQNLNLGQL